MYVYMCVCMHVCMHACMYLKYVCINACDYAYVYMLVIDTITSTNIKVSNILINTVFLQKRT